MTGRLRLTRLARQDLISIGRYTELAWGRGQRDRYLRALDRRFAALAARPALGAPRDALRRGYRSFPEGSHVIFYRVVRDGIEIVRILHEAMDVARHIGEDV